MTPFDVYADVEAWLDARPQFKTDGAKATDMRPAKIFDFCQKLGHPERTFPSVHVAGTNGKGTTCSMLASVYAQAGYQTGLYTSPHVEFWRERIKIDGRPADEGAVLTAFRKMAQVEGFDRLTYFELSTVACFLVFAEAGVDIAIIETGMGGRLDATNIIVPEVSVITSVGLDHTEYLGDDLASVAREKAGIIKPGVPVVAGRLKPEAERVVRETATALQCAYYSVGPISPDSPADGTSFEGMASAVFAVSDIPSVTSPLNMTLAAKVVSLLQGSFPVNDSDLVSGLQNAARNTGLHGRMERLSPERPWYYDGAHNAEALQVLLDNLGGIAPLESWTVVFTMMQDKVNDETARLFAPFGRRLFWRGSNPRSASEEQVRRLFSDVQAFTDDEIQGELARLTKEFVIFTGSFYFYSEARRWILSAEPGL